MSEDPKRISPQEAKQLVDDEGYLYLDVRTEAEWAAGHPVGAHNVPVNLAGPSGMTDNPDFLATVQANYPKDSKLVLGCKAGGRSLKAARMLIGAGYTAVVDQRAGYDGPRDSFGRVTEQGWAASGLPTEKETAGASYAELRAKKS